ncbi:hypothetical protein [Flammeovirga pacifica]|nr:hypothetical protein [Flammeovirga pacifica]
MRLYFSLLLSLVLKGSCFAQERGFSQEKLNAIKNDTDYQYVLPQYQIDIFDKIGRWLSSLLHTLFGGSTDLSGPVVRYFFWGAVIALLVWALYLILKTNKLFIFTTETKISPHQENKSIYSTHKELIPLSTQLEDALSRKEYQEVVRLYYSLAIEKLEQKDIINLNKVEHHNDILYQLKHELLKQPFNSIGVVFQYCFYGEFEANETICDDIKKKYQEFEIAIANHENK